MRSPARLLFGALALGATWPRASGRLVRGGRLALNLTGEDPAEVPAPPRGAPGRRAPEAANLTRLRKQLPADVELPPDIEGAPEALVPPAGARQPASPAPGVLLELHLTNTTLRELHKKLHGSLADFMATLRRELGGAMRLNASGVSILGIYGRYQRAGGGDSEEARDQPASRIGEEVIVRFLVKGRGEGGEEADVSKLLDGLREALRNPESDLRKGPLKEHLRGATVQLSFTSELANTRLLRGPRHHQLSSVAMPIAISAAFTGILIWLAAM